MQKKQLNQQQDGFQQILCGEVDKQTIGKIKKELFDSLSNQDPIKIAVIGECGVGKTSTINAIFNTTLRVSHTSAGTKKAEFNNVFTKKGEPITIIDMPGLGEVESVSAKHWETYQTVLPTIDSAIWVVSAGDRALESMQSSLKAIAKFSNDNLLERCIFGVNKSEHMYPEDWNNGANLPSVEQSKNLIGFCRTVENAIREVFPRLKPVITYYSALKQFRLDELLEQMLLAAPENRRPAIYKTSDVKKYDDMIQDKRALEVAKKNLHNL